MTNVHLTMRSSNRKVGPIPVSTSPRKTCPDACPLKGNGCYADGGPIAILWDKLSDGRDKHALSWDQFCDSVSQFPDEQLWRHDQAGDLPGENNEIDRVELVQLLAANRGKRGFTYTHKPLTERNEALIRLANMSGFTINISANNLQEADYAYDKGLPVTVVLSQTIQGNAHLETPKGRRISVCPATYSDTSCSECQLCQRQTRKSIVGFPAHGFRAKKASKIAMGDENV